MRYSYCLGLHPKGSQTREIFEEGITASASDIAVEHDDISYALDLQNIKACTRRKACTDITGNAPACPMSAALR